jgi:hypothetical protein
MVRCPLIDYVPVEWMDKKHSLLAWWSGVFLFVTLSAVRSPARTELCTIVVGAPISRN